MEWIPSGESEVGGTWDGNGGSDGDEPQNDVVGGEVDEDGEDGAVDAEG
ncbi:hypothetical protein Back11_33980 [Paenibacillus baekrokdamisoli]|uniref:Uncharacterized protein n=1 Tax=Paenibacillus baekrokdamisoli TaxID=1712516 RepID=A0A3G9JAX0_9BACL|nr:hypothetical protein [Paenibacillus baekrokdamisoli]MBB3073381.1 hypothetical protein [Paenibacillus baekrokdamisoli]BBH22053.1 hypothetical protein Back11_33980 [Paenibacillus baekrokdamisoli]